MAINPEDVKLYESERLTDESDGGGRATGRVVVDGDINNVFPDISRIDRTAGDVALRKLFVGIDTDNADTWLGGHAIIVAPPDDPNVHAVLFDAGNEYDERQEAQNRIEQYVVQGSRAQFELLGNQYENQRQIVGIQREENTLPATGDVYLLRLADQSEEQYVRISSVEHEVQTFTYQSGSSFIDFERRRLTMGISAPLELKFPGGEPTPTGTTSTNSTSESKSEVFTTEVADAARYWGVKNSTEDASQGDVSIKVPSLYANLVPSAQSEQPLTDQPLGYNRRTVREAADADYTESITSLYISSTEIRAFLVRPALPATLQLTLGGSVYTDDGSGTLTRSSGSFPFSTLAIDYATGTIEGTRDSGSGSGTSSGSATYRPGGPFTGRAETHIQYVTLNNRGYNWNATFALTKPRPGTMVISYMVLGKWYEVRDPGNGILDGDGSGSINYQTGTVTLSCLELPDVGSAIIYSYIMDIAEEIETHNGTLASVIPEIEVQLQPGVGAGSLVITYTSGAATKTLTDQGDSTLTGDGTGVIDYATGLARITPVTIPDDGTTIDASYDAVTPDTTTVAATVVDGSGVISGTIPDAPLHPGSVTFSATARRLSNEGQFVDKAVRIQDDGSGGFIGYAGTINYTTGAYSLTIARQYTRTFQSVNYTYELVA